MAAVQRKIPDRLPCRIRFNSNLLFQLPNEYWRWYSDFYPNIEYSLRALVFGTSSHVSDLEQVAIILIIHLSLFFLLLSSFQVVTFLPEG